MNRFAGMVLATALAACSAPGTKDRMLSVNTSPIAVEDFAASYPAGKTPPPAWVQDVLKPEIAEEHQALGAILWNTYRRSQKVSGTIKVGMVIAESGAVEAVRVIDNGTGDDMMARVVLLRLREKRFSRGPDGAPARVVVPFVFHQIKINKD